MVRGDHVDGAVRQALQALRERGIKLFLSTGRHLAMLDPVRQVFDFDGYVTLSGQYCTAQGQVLRSTPMPPEAVEELVAAARTDAFSCIFLEGEEIYINCINEMTRQFIRDLSIPMPLQRPADYARGREVYQAVTFLTREREHLLLDRAPHLKTTRWHPNFLDVIPPSGGKDRGMDALLDYFRIPVEDAMAFGDGENDLSMLVHAGIGVAMGTASDAVKAQADAIYPGSTVEEWYEYGGKPGYFRLRVNIMTVEEQEKFAAMSMAEIERRLAAAKRFSSHLEEVEYYDAGGTATGWGFAAYVGGELVESCTTIRVNPSPDDQKGTATAFALAACVGGILTEYGTTEQKEEALWPGSE